MKSIVLKCRVDPETKERWEAAARERGVSLSDLIRASVEKSISRTERTLFRFENGVEMQESVPHAPGVRRTPCKHGIAPWAVCAECDV